MLGAAIDQFCIGEPYPLFTTVANGIVLNRNVIYTLTIIPAHPNSILSFNGFYRTISSSDNIIGYCATPYRICCVI
ncbi:hypothetical protein ES703_100905 [subsurface metagenome]